MDNEISGSGGIRLGPTPARRAFGSIMKALSSWIVLATLLLVLIIIGIHYYLDVVGEQYSYLAYIILAALLLLLGFLICVLIVRLFRGKFAGASNAAVAVMLICFLFLCLPYIAVAIDHARWLVNYGSYRASIEEEKLKWKGSPVIRAFPWMRDVDDTTYLVYDDSDEIVRERDERSSEWVRRMPRDSLGFLQDVGARKEDNFFIRKMMIEHWYLVVVPSKTTK